MKKIIFGMAAFLACGIASAQGSDTMKFGVKAGVQFTNIVYSVDGEDDIEEADGAIGFFVAGLVDLPISGNFHVQPELMLSMEGAEDSRISYVRVPVMAKYYLMQGLSVQAGPEVAFKVAADDEIDESTKSFDFGIGAGAGYELPMGLMFDIRYNLGLNDISDVDQITAINTGLQIGVGYRF
ncbi:MAG TPA: porin family protein [Flavobacterium sp.]